MSAKYQAYAEYKDSGVEWLSVAPIYWDNIPIKYMALEKGSLFLDGDWIESKDIAGDTIRYITTGNVGEGKYKEQGSGYITEEKFKQLDCTEVFEGDILISRLNAPIGRSCIVPNLQSRVVTSVDNVIFRPDSKFYKQYLVHLFSSKDYFKHTANLARGATMQRISRGLLGNIRVVVPPYGEQETIANFLDHETAKIDTLIEKQQQLIKLLKEKRQAVISHAVTKGLNSNAPMRDSGVEWLGEVPQHWAVCRIKQVAKLESGHTPDKKKEEYWVDCDIPWVSLNDSSQLKEVNYITDTAIYLNEKGIENSSARKLPKRCVVFTRDASIGLSAITTRVMAVSQHVIAWICDERKVVSEYLLLVFYAMEEELDRYTSGATLKTIGMPDVNKLTGAFPCVNEQEEIAEHVFSEMNKFDLLITKAEEVVGIIRERRTALISAAVTGKIDLRNWQAPYKENKEAAL